VEHLTEEARQHKKIQSEKHGLGKDQANASWTSHLGNPNGIAPNRADDMAQEIEEEEVDDEVPAFVSRSPQVGSLVDTSHGLAEVGEPGFLPTKVVTSNQDLLDEAEPGDTVVLRFQDNVAPTLEAIKDTVKITGPVTLPLATPEQVADFLNEDDAPKQAAVMAAGASTLKSRKRLILTEDEELM